MELTADDFQNNLDQATINSFVSHLIHWVEQNTYSKARNENNTAYLKKIHQKTQKFLKCLEPCLA